MSAGTSGYLPPGSKVSSVNAELFIGSAPSLADFLLARITEDEDEDEGRVPMPSMEHEGGSCGDCGGMGATRFLAECDAKRRIVALHDPGAEGMICGTCFDWNDDPFDATPERWPCATMRALALPYADHPDYLEEWKP